MTSTRTMFSTLKRAFRDVASAEGLTIMEQARLFAMLNMAGADALINCFNDKEY